MTDPSKTQGSSPIPVFIEDDYTSDMSRVLSTHSIRAEAANLPPAIPPFGSSPATSGSRLGALNHPVDIVEQIFTAHGSPVPSNSVVAYENGLIDLPQEEVAKVVKEHFLIGSPTLSGRQSPSIRSNLGSEAGNSSNPDDQESAELALDAVHQLHGGDMVDGIYKWAANVESQQISRLKRSQSVSLPSGRGIEDATVAGLTAPGGFRRHYVISKAAEEGRPPPSYITRNFFDFLCLYGRFGGEDLDDDDDYEDENDEDEEEATGIRRRRRRDENTPLLPKPNAAPQGTATASKAVFLLLKSFVGTGMLITLSKQIYHISPILSVF
jgi:proton-coupled amino acid transporter